GAEFYRRRLAGVSPDDVGAIEDLARLPFTTKNDLREQYPFGLLAAPSGEIVRIHASSGSTGKPTVVAYTRADLALWANVLARGLVAGGLTSADVFQNAYGYGLFTGGLGFHDAASLVGAAVVPTSSGNTPRQVMLMRDFGVTALAATPSYAINVAAKEAFPVLRYRTRDRARLTREPCACGRTMARILEILGRTDDMLIVRGVNVFPSQIEHALLGVDGLAPHYQIVLTTRADRHDELRVRIEAAAG